MIQRVDRQIFREVFGPWLFGTAMFTVLIMAGTYLGRIAEYAVKGVSLTNVGYYSALLLPAVMVKTFAMAVLLAMLLAFGRLSSDSEIVALRAAGVSLMRIMRPVILFAGAVAVLAFAMNEILVPSAALKVQAMSGDITKLLSQNARVSMSRPLEYGGKLRGYLVARDFSFSDRSLRGVTILTYNDQGQRTYNFDIQELVFDSNVGPQDLLEGKGGWRIKGGAKLTPAAGGMVITINDQMWPEQVARPNVSPEDLLIPALKDYDAFSMGKLKSMIAKEKLNKDASKSEIRNMEYCYWNKFALPLAALVFGLLGAPLGIRSHRTSAASGFALSIAIIFGYMLIVNTLNVYAMNGAIPSWSASFAPTVVGLIVAALILKNKNQ